VCYAVSHESWQADTNDSYSDRPSFAEPVTNDSNDRRPTRWLEDTTYELYTQTLTGLTYLVIQGHICTAQKNVALQWLQQWNGSPQVKMMARYKF